MRSVRAAWVVAAAAGVLAYAWWASVRPPFSLSAHLAVFAAAGALLVVGTRAGRVPPASACDREHGRFVAGLLLWAVLAASVVGFELFNWLQHPRDEHPTMSALVNSVDTRAVRPVLFVGWLALGWHLVRR